MNQAAEVEHIWTPIEEIPLTLHKMFPDGAAVVFADEVFTAAIPATAEETNQLADLMEEIANADPKDKPIAVAKYDVLRTRLCGVKTYNLLSLLFKQEMEKVQKEEERREASPYSQLASAYRPKNHELN